MDLGWFLSDSICFYCNESKYFNTLGTIFPNASATRTNRSIAHDLTIGPVVFENGRSEVDDDAI